jgi:hypothetical protein
MEEKGINSRKIIRNYRKGRLLLMARYEDLIITEADKKMANLILNFWDKIPQIRDDIYHSKGMDRLRKKKWIKYLDQTSDDIGSIYDFLCKVKSDGKKKKLSFSRPTRYVPEVAQDIQITDERRPEDIDPSEQHEREGCTCPTCTRFNEEQAYTKLCHQGAQMPNRSMRKGHAYERKIAKKLGEAFNCNIRRVPCSGALDIKGDIRNLEGVLDEFIIECKKQEKTKIWEWIKQTQTQAGNKMGLLIFTRNRAPDYACLLLDDLIRILKNDKENDS